MHVDMDAFYACIEQRDNPVLKGLPVIVGGLGNRGVVSTASYEARKFGVHSAMPMATARKLCPEAVFILPNHRHYQEVSSQIMKIFDGFSPLVEPLSIDEAFLDVSGIKKAVENPEEYASELKKQIKEQTGLTASVGIAPNKFLAKLASDYKKPDGLMRIKPEDIQGILDPLPVSYLFGIGKTTRKMLGEYGISTIKQFRQADRRILEKVTGRQTDSFLFLANGIDERPVQADREAKSIGKENTYEKDLTLDEDIKREILLLAQKVGWRLRREGLCGFTLTVKIRYPDFETHTRSISAVNPFYHDEDIYKEAIKLSEKVSFKKGIRLIGVSVSKLKKYEETMLSLDFDGQEERKIKRTQAVDELKKRFGEKVIGKGVLPEEE